MDYTAFLFTAIPIVIGGIGYIMKSHLERIALIEQKANEALTEEKLRVILADKIDPVREDIREIKDQILELTRLILK